MAMDPEQFAKICRALADPQRLTMLERIAAHPEVACKCLVDELPITQATISHHLKELAGAGLISVRREGKCCHFKLESRVFRSYQRELSRRVPTGAQRGARGARGGARSGSRTRASA